MKLFPRNVNKEHYTQIHPVFSSKGMSINLWRDFLRDIEYVPLMSWKEYINLEENSYFSWLERAFFHVCVFAWSLVLFALGYTNYCSNETCIEELQLFIGVLLFLSLSTHFCVNWYRRSFHPKTLQKIISRYAALFSEMGVIVTLSDDMTITIEAHL